jgi:S-adenosylmethionine-diacylglycerol 3-amino-3-carboxypropyl transferase
MRPPDARSEIAARADFSRLRYSQCWEDADVLLEALAIRPGDRCFSVCSGGDNSLSLLSCGPAEVLAVDLSPAQTACLELKAAGFRVLPHVELLELAGIAPSARRAELYRRVRGALPPPARRWWDANLRTIERGVAGAGRFESYLSLFRRWVLPLVHGRACRERLFAARDAAARRAWYDAEWDGWRWQALFRLFFSRPLLGRLGRDPAFFAYVDGGAAAPLLRRAEHGLVDLDPARNPYLQWIAFGRHLTALPHAWRPENFAPIRDHLDRLRIEVASVEQALAAAPDTSIDRFNLSDIFEYLSPAACEAVFDDVARSGRPGGRAVSWNLFAPRRRPERLAGRLRALDACARELHGRAATFFYGALLVDEVA